MSKPLVVQKILESKTIVDFLRERGIDPAKESGTRYKYLCPLHGPEKDPSFFVSNDSEFQQYYCFGCKKHGDLINLICELDHISLAECLKRMSDGISIPENELYNYLADKAAEVNDILHRNLEDISLGLSISFRTHRKITNNDPLEIEFLERVFKEVDKLINAMDISQLQVLYPKLVNEGIPSRTEKWQDIHVE